MLALSAALAAACFVKAFGVTFLGRPRSPAPPRRAARPIASRSPPCSSSRRCACSPASARLRHRRAGAGQRRRWSAARMPARRRSPGSRSCRSAASRSSYNGLLVFLFIAAVGLARRVAIHRLASRRGAARRRPGIAAFPMPSPVDPIQRRLASPSRSAACSAPWSFGPASGSRCRRRATSGRRGSTVELHDPVWEYALCADRGACRLRRRAAQPSAVPDHPPLSQPRLRALVVAAPGAGDMALIGDSGHPGRADAAGAAAGAAASPASCAR